MKEIIYRDKETKRIVRDSDEYRARNKNFLRMAHIGSKNIRQTEKVERV